MKKVKKNTGKESESIFMEFIENQGKKAYLERLVDTNDLKRQGKNTIVKKSPADFILTINGIMGYTEIKSCAGDKASFSFSQFTNSQMVAIKKQTAAKGAYWVFIHNLHHQQWYFLMGAEIIKTLEEGKKSIPWVSMTKITISREQITFNIGNYIW